MGARDTILAEITALEAEAKRRQVQEVRERWCPHDPTPIQKYFLDLDDEEALYGGAAGGGKSDALLMGLLSHVDVPTYAGLGIRRTYADLSLPGAIMDRAQEWLGPTAARWNHDKKRWTFPSGASLTFGYLETDRDVYRYQSAEFQEIAFDELTQFTERQYTYLTTRLRAPANFPFTPRMRSASNPGGIGHKWVHDRFVGAESTFPFVPARIRDNPHINQAEYAQLMNGEWVQDVQGLIYPYTRGNLIERVPRIPGTWYHVLGVDLGASEAKPTTAFCVVGWCDQVPRGVWVIQSEAEAGMIPSSIAARIEELMEDYGGFTQIVVDEGALGKGYNKEFREVYALPTLSAEKQSKMGFRKLLRGALERQEVQIVEVSNKDLLGEMDALRWNEDGTDNEKGADNHVSDALLYSWRATKSHAAQLPQPTIKRYSREWYDRESEEMEQADLKRCRNRVRDARNPRPWWRRNDD
jgi:hypothetical protein